MSTARQFLAEIKSGAKILGIAPTTLCQRSVKNGKVIRRLERGGSITTDTMDKIRAYITTNKRKVAA